MYATKRCAAANSALSSISRLSVSAVIEFEPLRWRSCTNAATAVAAMTRNVPTAAIAVMISKLNGLWPQRFFDRFIFRPRRAFDGKLLYLGGAQMLAQRGHELLVTALPGRFALLRECLELRIDVTQ